MHPNSPHRVVYNGIAAVSKSDVWAVGYTGGGSGTSPQSVALHWNGSKWENVPTPALPRGAVLSAVSAAGANDAWAVGLKYDDATQGKPNQTLTMRWNGTQWSVVQNPNADLDVTSWSSLNAVTALPGGEAWAFGFYNQNCTPYQPLFMQWKGVGVGACLQSGRDVCHIPLWRGQHDEWYGVGGRLTHIEYGWRRGGIGAQAYHERVCIAYACGYYDTARGSAWFG